MPSKVAEAVDDGECATADTTRSSSLTVTIVNETPIWALATDSRPLDNLSHMMVCGASFSVVKHGLHAMFKEGKTDIKDH